MGFEYFHISITPLINVYMYLQVEEKNKASLSSLTFPLYS